MKKINWVRKLTSRKLWTAVASFVSMMIVATGGAENTATQKNNRNRGRETVPFSLIGGRSWTKSNLKY